MSKALETLFELVKTLARKHIPPLYVLIGKSLELKAVGLSVSAHYSRKLGFRAILTIGVLASIYSVYLFALNELSPGMPKASHDILLKTRLSSPEPSKNIVILDVDERSLALLSEKYGRWPWSRDVLADGLQKTYDLGAKAVLFNVLLSDPDKSNPDADAAMSVTADINRTAAFPLIRLNSENDSESKLKLVDIPGAQLEASTEVSRKIAVILPVFSSMHDRLGVANQSPDPDGIIRKYPIRWQEEGFFLPSLVSKTADLGGVDLSQTPSLISLNWRNKQGRYARISFGDLFLDKLEPGHVAIFSDAFVIISLSAPGLGQTKPTAVKSVEDDAEVLATALDDALNATYLRTMPNLLVFLLNFGTIWVLVWISIQEKSNVVLNRAFLIGQSALGTITLLSVSYTNYLIDLSESMSFGLSVFAAIKVVASMDDSWSRAKPGFRKVKNSKVNGKLLILGFIDNQSSSKLEKALQKRLEQIVGLANVVRVDDLFGGESFIASTCGKFRALIINLDENHSREVRELFADERYSFIDINTYETGVAFNPEDSGFVEVVAPLVVSTAARLFEVAKKENTVD